MVPAKKFGVKVTQYMVGFGPTLWSRKRGDTEYGVKAIPLGGYIRMIGMVPPRADGTRSRWPRRMATAVEDFRQVSRAEVDPPDDDRAVLPADARQEDDRHARRAVHEPGDLPGAAPSCCSTIGIGRSRQTTRRSAVVQQVRRAGQLHRRQQTAPARRAPQPRRRSARCKPGDQFLSINGTKVTSWDAAHRADPSRRPASR